MGLWFDGFGREAGEEIVSKWGADYEQTVIRALNSFQHVHGHSDDLTLSRLEEGVRTGKVVPEDDKGEKDL